MSNVRIGCWGGVREERLAPFRDQTGANVWMVQTHCARAKRTQYAARPGHAAAGACSQSVRGVRASFTSLCVLYTDVAFGGKSRTEFGDEATQVPTQAFQGVDE